MRWTDFSVRWTRFSLRGCATLGVAGAVALLSGCVVAPVDDGYADYGYSSTTVYTNYGYPPPPRVEYRTVAPAPNYIWIGAGTGSGPAAVTTGAPGAGHRPAPTMCRPPHHPGPISSHRRCARRPHGPRCVPMIAPARRLGAPTTAPVRPR